MINSLGKIIFAISLMIVFNKIMIKYLVFFASLQISLSILVPLCSDINQIILPFTDINGKADPTTIASMCHDT
jgi:hypothetical protein